VSIPTHRPDQLTPDLKGSTMHAKFALAAAAIAFAGSALAESPTIVDDTFQSVRTRAEVRADLDAYRQAGVNPWSTSYNPLRAFRSGKSRAEVTAEYVAARDVVRAFNGEDSGAHYLAQHQLPAPAAGTAIAQRPAH
jgi:hypothetical protein